MASKNIQNIPPPPYQITQTKKPILEWTKRIDSAYAMPEVYQKEKLSNSRHSISYLCSRLCIILLSIVVITTIIFSLVYAFSSGNYYNWLSKHQHGKFNNNDFDTFTSKDQLTDLTNVGPSPSIDNQITTTTPSGDWICYKYCYNNIYVACPCNEFCECPPNQLDSSEEDNKKQLIDNSLGYEGEDEEYNFDFVDSDNICVALCFPDFISKQVACEDLSTACDY